MQKIIDLKNGALDVQTIPPQSLNANTNGSAADMASAADIACNAEINIGTITGSAVVSVKLQESATTTSADFADFADTTNTQTGNLNTANTVTVLRFQRSKRYVRAVVTLVSGTSLLIGINLIGQKKVEGSNAAGYSLT